MHTLPLSLPVKTLFCKRALARDSLAIQRSLPLSPASGGAVSPPARTPLSKSTCMLQRAITVRIAGKGRHRLRWHDADSHAIMHPAPNSASRATLQRASPCQAPSLIQLDVHMAVVLACSHQVPTCPAAFVRAHRYRYSAFQSVSQDAALRCGKGSARTNQRQACGVLSAPASTRLTSCLNSTDWKLARP